ncbi:hypothetical protein CI109_100610 [Kwoniella shandongensis]|uniref:Leucine carboxyl methyltransferase 1 n=1 Tax=Kwoniella shandongensis TaxID=1734106 RepID=A0A5M6C4S5_9TREE|nr:uncharacterized protein CI109_003468 [Kwoniella shandongensis]KAA5528179.1 hypothetical protein CI109_003468 [Kwoniella shandongensis]
MLPPRMPSRLPQGNGNDRAGLRPDPDDAIRLTDDDAASSRLSATNAGYLPDPFVSLLYKPRLSSTDAQAHVHAGGIGGGPSSRKPPLINVGTHHRTRGIDLLIDKFLDQNQGGGAEKQIVSLGAGSDTRFWRLMSRAQPPSLAKYVEIDFPHLTSPKAQRIARSRKLSQYLTKPKSTSPRTTSDSLTTPMTMAPPNPTATTTPPFTISQGGTSLQSQNYLLLPLDLRPSPSSSSSSSSNNNNNEQTISEILTSTLLPHLDPTLPTLFLAECLFPYMPPGDSEAVISWFGNEFERCVGVVYEMVGLGDSFGNVMKRNLASRNLSIPGSIPFTTPQSQADRFLASHSDSGSGSTPSRFTEAGAKTLWQVREECIDPNELHRISKLEFLDEIEELRLVLEHYVIAWGTKGEGMGSISL